MAILSLLHAEGAQSSISSSVEGVGPHADARLRRLTCSRASAAASEGFTVSRDAADKSRRRLRV